MKWFTVRPLNTKHSNYALLLGYICLCLKSLLVSAENMPLLLKMIFILNGLPLICLFATVTQVCVSPVSIVKTLLMRFCIECALKGVPSI